MGFTNFAIYLGIPQRLPTDVVQAVTNSAISAMMEEQNRTRAGFYTSRPVPQYDMPKVPDPDSRGAATGSCYGTGGWAADRGQPAANLYSGVAAQREQLPVNTADSPMAGFNLEIWKLLPHIKDLPEEMVKQLPLPTLLQLNTALAKESRSAEKLSVNARLTQNAQKLLTSPVEVKHGWDDRKELLHEARFLGGSSCSGQHMWLRAREVLGAKGVVPLGNYDMDSVGCGGCVTPRGWQELHCPASPDLKLKMFYMPNVASSTLSARKVNLEDGESGLSIGDSMRDIADFDGFRAALHTLREAMAVALPWNRSVGAILGFMMNTNYCAADLQNNPKRAAILAEFVDFCLGRNSLNWENKMPYLSADELTHVWASWRGKRAAFFMAAGAGTDKSKKDKLKKRDDICRRYNRGDCPYKAEDCKTYYGLKLRHVCSYVLPGGGGRKCELDHPKPDHK
jgi:hypothetical protein